MRSTKLSIFTAMLCLSMITRSAQQNPYNYYGLHTPVNDEKHDRPSQNHYSSFIYAHQASPEALTGRSASSRVPVTTPCITVKKLYPIMK